LTRRGFLAYWRARISGPHWAAPLLIWLAVWLSAPAFGQTAAGTVIANQATLNYIDPSGSPVTVLSNQFNITTVVARSNATLDIVRVVNPPGTALSVGPTACAQGGVFVPLPDPVLLGGLVIDPAQPQVLASGMYYHAGEPIFVRLQDIDQNLDMAVRETALVTLNATPPADTEVIRLTETAVNSGLFAGYIQTGSGPAAPGDCILQVAQNGSFNANYQDPADATDNAGDAALVDPFGMVFDSSLGNAIDGATVRLVVDSTGLPATVFGDDGVSTFPSEVISGGSATDSSGTVYTFSPGGFRFPLVSPDDYRFIVVPPPGYLGPSTVSIPALQTLPGAPFALGSGSFGNVFTVDADLAVSLDVPLDPSAPALFLQKTTTTTVAGPGDFIQFALAVENTSPSGTITTVGITDVLPPGFRYIDGSTRLDGSPAADPAISPDGRTLTFAVGDLAVGENASIRYVVEITLAAEGESATNLAVAASAGGAQSNEATATVQLTEELFASQTFLVGRVIKGSCDSDVANDLQGVAGVRVYLEDGRYAVTDEGGRYHFEGLEPGTHVVQMDTDTVPGYLETYDCEQNSRFAGSAYSQFVDLNPGSLWRADFHLRERPDPTGSVALRLTSEPDRRSGQMAFTLELQGDSVPIENLSVSVILPEGLSYLNGSSIVDGAPAEDALIIGSALSYRLDEWRGAWQSSVEFRARVEASADGHLSTRAVAVFDTPVARGQRTPVAENLFISQPERVKQVEYDFMTRFGVMGAELEPPDKRELDAVVDEWRDVGRVELIVTGHADSSPIRQRSQSVFADNYVLSLARAEAVATYLAEALGLRPEQISTVGRGPDEPIANNATAEGRALNRRVELSLQGQRTVNNASLEVVTDDSGLQAVETRGRHRRADELSAVPADIPPDIYLGFSVPIDVDRLDPGIEWLAPVEGFSPRIPSLKIAIQHVPGQLVELRLNDRAVSPLNFDSVEVNQAETVAVSRWRGVDLEDGHNELVAIVRDGESIEVARFERSIHFSGGPVRGSLVPEKSTLVADGRTRAVVALQMFDRWGERAREATIGAFRVDPPYRSWWEVESLQQNQLIAVGQREPMYKVAPDGLAYIELEPTTRTGEAVVHLLFPDQREQEIRVWLEPAPRDWILVGFAEGTLGYNTIEDNTIAAHDAGHEDNLYEDGRIAFFAKGQIKGEYLLTLAYDSAINEAEAENSLHGTIDPDRYYTLYGDGTEQRFEAASRRSVYLKIERRDFFALFGDYDTGLTVTELSRYSRSLNGLQSEYHGDRFSYSAFAAETDTAFVKDELNGDGTSGPYRLSRRPIVINSDKISLEVRDRFRSEVVLESRILSRHLDYNIDYLTGTLIMKQPVESRDQNFNPVYIIADYESLDTADEAVTVGARAALTTADRRLEIGASVIHEGTVGDEGDLYGADLRYQLSDVTEIKAEFAYTNTEVAGRGRAFLAELDYQGERAQARAYLQEQEADFGLGQQRSTEAGMRKFGVDGQVRLSPTLSLSGAAFRQDNLEDVAQRDVAEAEIRHQTADRSVTLGLSSARDRFSNGDSLVSNQAFVSGSVDMLDHSMTVVATAETALGGQNGNVDYPDRTRLGLDYRLTDSSTLFGEVEDARGATFDSLMTRVGVRTAPWNNAQLNSAVNHEMTEYGPRTFATMGLIQRWQWRERWSFDLGLDQATTIGDNSERVNDNVPPASGAIGEDFRASYAGALYRAEDWTFTSRLEYREFDFEDRLSLFGGFYREPTMGHGFSASMQLFNSQTPQGLDSTQADLRLGWAYRPSSSAWVVFDRLDLIYDERDDGLTDFNSWRVINNLNANWMVNRQTQVALQYGAKYVRSNIDDEAYTGYTDLFGAGFRRDLNRRWDAGLHANLLHSWRSDVMEFGWGIDLGVTIARNIWLSFGYNFAGFDDADFSGGNYTAQGPFITIRMKVDQNTLRGLATGGHLPGQGDND